jgi:hypothetical protein
MANKFNVFLIASHHGVFLTLESLKKLKEDIGELVIVIPEDKLEKYSNMEGAEFKNFQKLIVKQAKKIKKEAGIYTAKFDIFRRVSQTAEFLREINASGVWLQVCAGSVVNRLPGARILGEMADKYLLMSPMRCYEGNKRLDMYAMLGEPDLKAHEKQNTATFVINADHIPVNILPDMFMIREAIDRLMFKSINSHAFSSQESLVELAFGGKQLLDHAALAENNMVGDYWQFVIQPRLGIDVLYAYPLEQYLPYISKLKGLVPEVTIDRIKANALEAKNYSLAFRDALR